MIRAFGVEQMGWTAKKTEVETTKNLCSSKTEQ